LRSCPRRTNFCEAIGYGSPSGCADADSFETTVLDPAPKVELLRGSAKSSLVELPIVMTATDSNRDEQHVLEAPDRAMAKV
jgi:hypothetical protein